MEIIKRKNHKKLGGFSILEATIAMFIFVVIITVSLSVFASMIRSRKGSRDIQKRLEETRTVLEIMTKNMRMSSKLKVMPNPYETPIFLPPCDDPCTSSCTCNAYHPVNNPDGVPGWECQINADCRARNSRGVTMYNNSQGRCFAYLFDSGKLKVADYLPSPDCENPPAESWNDLISYDIQGNFYVIETEQDNPATPTPDGIVGRAAIFVQIGTNSSDFLQTAVSFRDYQGIFY